MCVSVLICRALVPLSFSLSNAGRLHETSHPSPGMAAKAPVSPERRKKVLKVLFVSLLLDLVCKDGVGYALPNV